MVLCAVLLCDTRCNKGLYATTGLLFKEKTVQGLILGNFEIFSPFLVCLCYRVIREDASPFSNTLFV